MWPVSQAFRDALTDGRRTERFKAELYDRNFNPVGTPLVLDKGGSVELELKGEPQGRASFALLDNNNVLPSQNDARWHSWNVKLSVEMFVSGGWEAVPLFFGPIQDVSQDGMRYEVDADTKDAQHLAPHFFDGAFNIPKHTKYHHAIRRCLETRDERFFDLAQVARRLPERRHGWFQTEPWKVLKSLARDVNMHAFYRGDGTFKLHRWPDSVAWRFQAGDKGTLTDYPEERSSVGPVRNKVVIIGHRTDRKEVPKRSETDEKILVDDTSFHLPNEPNFLNLLEDGMKVTVGVGSKAQNRTIAGSYTPGSRTVPVTFKFTEKHAKGSPVKIVVKKDVESSVIGEAELPAAHKYSAQSMTGGKRPRIESFDRPGIHKAKEADNLAENVLARIGGESEQSISFSTVPIWMLELGDIIVVDWRSVDHRSRVQRLSFPLDIEGTMNGNWLGERPPKGKR